MKNLDLRQKVQDSLLLCLRDVPAVRNLDFKSEEMDSPADLTVEVTTDRETYRLIVEIKSSGQPRYARDAVARLSIKSGQSSMRDYPVFAAPSFRSRRRKSAEKPAPATSILRETAVWHLTVST